MHGLDVQSLAVFDSTRNRRDMKSQEKGSTIKCKGHILWANSTSRMEPQHYRCRPLIWGILPVCQGHSFHTFLSGTRFCDEQPKMAGGIRASRPIVVQIMYQICIYIYTYILLGNPGIKIKHETVTTNRILRSTSFLHVLILESEQDTCRRLQDDFRIDSHSCSVS